MRIRDSTSGSKSALWIGRQTIALKRKISELSNDAQRRQLACVPQARHTFGMTATVKLDGSNRIVLSRDQRRAAGIPHGQKLKVSATPGRGGQVAGELIVDG